MPTLEHDQLVFRFPQIEEEASFAIDFQRTLRIPDSERTYPLPPGLGKFPLRHTEDYPTTLPALTNERGGVILPMWQAEAMWLSFSNSGPTWDLDFPVAIKVAAGKVNAVTGEDWRSGLQRDPQDYLVSPGQPWLDGFAVAKDVVRQFVAMPLGEGYSAEEQLTGQPEWGGLQIAVMPLKRAVWQRKRREWEDRRQSPSPHFASELPTMLCEATMMGLAPGGKMRQSIYRDTFSLDDWDVAAADRVFVTLAHAKDWKSITGEAALTAPPSAASYAAAGLPWFSYYAADLAPVHGTPRLSRLASLGALFKQKTGVDLPEAGDVTPGKVIQIASKSGGARPVRRSGKWDASW